MKPSPHQPWHRQAIPGLLLRAAIIVVLFGGTHLLGWRQYTALMTGTVPLDFACRLYGASYIVLYVGAVLAAPICVIAAGLLAAMNRWLGPKETDPPNVPPVPSA